LLPPGCGSGRQMVIDEPAESWKDFADPFKRENGE
jgi:hypothetical protein